MWALRIIASFLSLSFVSVTAVDTAAYNSTGGKQYQIDRLLGPELSKQASIVHYSSAAPRWSDFKAPDPGTVVNVATETDVLLTVRYCNAHNISFLAQGGGNGWISTWNIGPNDVVINLRGIRKILFNANKTEVSFQGGTLVSELVDAAYGNDTQVVTGNCNCIGVLGATLGGGYGRLMGLYGFGIDNLLSLNLITSNGSAIKVTPDMSDLWWALRGAGPNFGIVTSATMKAHPIPKSQNGAWLGPLIFTEDKIEALVQAINDLDLEPRMAIFLYYAAFPPAYTPTIVVIPFFLGNETGGTAAFSSILELDPVSSQTAWTPYNLVNAGSESFCVKGGRKPSYTAGMAKLDPKTWRAIWNQYTSFLQQNPGTGNTTVLLECYSLYTADAFGDNSSSYAFRSSNKYNAVLNTVYDDRSLDGKAQAFGSSVRDLWWSTDDLTAHSAYINYANGDEALKTVYGGNVARLQKLKKTYDPFGRFDQFFPLLKQT